MGRLRIISEQELDGIRVVAREVERDSETTFTVEASVFSEFSDRSVADSERGAVEAANELFLRLYREVHGEDARAPRRPEHQGFAISESGT